MVPDPSESFHRRNAQGSLHCPEGQRADGLAEELLNVLAGIHGLRVASQTSACSFKGTPTDIPTIALKLNVATILEGGVRKAGKRVRITAQVIRVATDSHLWSNTYDGELEDIFAVQYDIAQAVVNELRTTLLGEAIFAKCCSPTPKPQSSARSSSLHRLRSRTTRSD